MYPVVSVSIYADQSPSVARGSGVDCSRVQIMLFLLCVVDDTLLRNDGGGAKPFTTDHLHIMQLLIVMRRTNDFILPTLLQ